MKKKVVIQGVPKSSKKKVVIEGLPKADIGKRMAKKKDERMQSAWDKDIAQYPNANVSPSQNMSGVDTEGNPISINPNNNPLLTNPLFNLKRGQFNNYQINEDNTYYCQYHEVTKYLATIENGILKEIDKNASEEFPLIDLKEHHNILSEIYNNLFNNPNHEAYFNQLCTTIKND
jgi:hypothetical protein